MSVAVVSGDSAGSLVVAALRRLGVEVAGVDAETFSRLDDIADTCAVMVIAEDASVATQRRALRWAESLRAAFVPPPSRRPPPHIVLTATSGRLDDDVCAASDMLVCTTDAVARLSGRTVADSLDADDAASAVARRTGATVIVTLDEQGAAVARRGRATYIPPFTVEVVDRTGAWECFCAALALAVAEGFDNFAATGYAMAATAVCVGRAGGEESLPTRDDVERMAHSVDLRRDPGTSPLQFPR